MLRWTIGRSAGSGALIFSGHRQHRISSAARFAGAPDLTTASMVRRFFRDSAIYLIPSVLSSGMTFVMFPFYAHHFSPRQYGVFDLLGLTAMLVGWTVSLEIYQGVGIYVAGEQDPDRVQGYASTALWFALAAYGTFVAATETLAVPASHALLGSHVAVTLLRVAIPWMALQGILAIVQAQLRWQLRPKAFALGAVINATITVVASGVLVFGANMGVEGAILGQLAGTAASLIYVLGATYGTFVLRFSAAGCRRMLSYSIPMVPSSVGVFLNLYADRLVIQHMRSLSDVGVYGVGYRLAMVVTLLLTAFQGAAMPLILARKDEPSTPDDLARIFRIFVALALSAFVALTLLATPALRLLAAPEYQRAASVVPLLVVAVAFANMYIFAPGLAIKKRALPMAGLTAAAGVANLVLALVLVPPLGITGAGLATASTSLVWFVALMAVSQRMYHAPHRWRQLIPALVVIAGCVALALIVLPTSRARALDPGLLAIRIGLTAAGIALAALLSLGGTEFGAAARAFESRVRRQRPSRRQRQRSRRVDAPRREFSGG